MRKYFRPFLILNFIRTNPTRSVIYPILFMLFFVEVLLYSFATLSWFEINCRDRDECTKILLVADPQLIGLHNEPHPFLTPISIWDSDRYLSKTFSYAFQFTRPDVVVFLGDLFDEGSTATAEEFKVYYDRLVGIFAKKKFSYAKHIWLPGDNDIGGEGNDRITDNKVKRFQSTFQQSKFISIKDSVFYKIDELTSKGDFDAEYTNGDKVIVGLNHMPMISRRTTYIEKVLETLKPNLLFTAHTHKSSTYKTSLDTYEYSVNHSDELNKVYHYDLGDEDIYEIAVPTCSYRMGTVKIGYGFAVIENKSLRYTVLWSPDRYKQIIFYGITLIFIVLYILTCMYKRIYNTRKKVLLNTVLNFI